MYATLAPALDALPTAAHRAFLRLLLDAVVARRHRRHAHPSGWPSFIACGPTKTGKNLVVTGVCRLIGVDPARVVRSVPAETERSLYGRRHQLPGGAWALRPSPLLGEPLLALDELDKAPREVQRACLKLLQGEARIGGEEGEIVEVAPVVVVLANGFPGQLPPEYRRRSVVLDTSGLVAELGNIYAAAAAFLDALPGRLDLDALAVSAGPVPVSVVDTMAAALRPGLSEQGWRLCDERGLAHLVPGRMALSGLDTPAAALAVVGDYLDVAATVGETAGMPGPVEPAPDAVVRRAAAAEQARREREDRSKARGEEIRLAGAIGQCVYDLKAVRPDPEDFEPGGRPHAAAVAGKLDAIIAQVEEVGSLDELAEVVADAEPVYLGARVLADTRHQRVVVNAIPSGERVVVESIPSGDDDDEEEEEEPWCEWRCQYCGETGEDFDEPDVCPECGSGDLAITFHPERLEAPSVLAALEAGPLASSPLGAFVVAIARLVEGGHRSRALSGVAESALVVPARALPSAPTTQVQANPCPVCRTQFPPCGAACCPIGAPREATRTVPGRAIEPA